MLSDVGNVVGSGMGGMAAGAEVCGPSTIAHASDFTRSTSNAWVAPTGTSRNIPLAPGGLDRPI